MFQLLGGFQAFRGRMCNLSPGGSGSEQSRGRRDALGCQGPSASDFSRDIFYMGPIGA